MKQRPRRYITEPEMALIWDRWEKGESLNAIVRDLGRYHSAVQGLWRGPAVFALRRDDGRVSL